MAFCSFASADITVKIVVPALGNFDLMGFGYEGIQDNRLKKIIRYKV